MNEAIDLELANYATIHKEIPLLVRWNGEKAIGLFEEWTEIERAFRVNVLTQMAQIHALYRIYMAPVDEFGLYYVAHALDTKTDPNPTIQSAIQIEAIDIRLKPYLATLKERMQSVEGSLNNTNFYENLKRQRRAFHRKDARLVNVVEQFNLALTQVPRYLSCITITELHEEIPYVSVKDLWTMFDQARMTENVPCSNYSGFYKMLETVPVKAEWSPSTSDCLSVYANHQQRYHRIFIHTDNVVIQSKFQTNGETPQDVISSIQRTYGISLPQTTDHQKSIEAICYLDAPTINLKLFLIFIYRHPIYSHYLFTEESRSVMKDKTFIYCSYFPNPRRPNRNITFTMKQLPEEESKRVECDLPGKKYATFLRVRIRKCGNQADILTTLHALSIMIAQYKAQESSLIEELAEQGIPIPVDYQVQLKRSTKAKPSGFVFGSSRNQPNAPRRLTIEEMKGQETAYYHVNLSAEPYQWVSEERKNELLDSDGEQKPQVLLFPKHPSEGEQFFYICEKKGFPFADLRTFKEEDQTVFAPSCFSTAQSKKSKLSVYEENKEIEEVVGIRPIATGKTLKPGQLGLVQPWMERWYQLHDTTNQLIRKGVSNRSLDSVLYVLECIKSEDLRIPSEENVNRVKRDMLSLLQSDERYVNEIMSEGYGKSREDLLHQFEFGYIDPLLYYSFLCRYYQLQMLLFRKDGIRKEDYFYLSHPRCAHTETQSQLYDRTIAIVMNQGQEFGKRSHPLCELVARIPYEAISKWTLSMVIWSAQSEWVQYALQTQQEMYQKTIRSLPETSLISITHQTLDEYGHAAWIHGDMGSMHVLTPLHSQFLPQRLIIDSSTITCWIEEDINQLQLYTTIVPESYSDFTGYRVQWDGVTYFIPFEYHPSSTLHDYRLFEKTSRYLVEYTFYLFSHYMKAHPEITLDNLLAHLDDFSTTTFIIEGTENDNDYCKEADHIQREIRYRNKWFDGTHLSIPNELVRKKLMYSLWNEVQTQRERLIRYQAETHLRRYYVHVWDCISYPYHHLVTGESSYLTYVKHRNDTIHHGSDSILPTSVDPYMLYLHQPIQGIQKWLMQPVASMNEAFLRWHQWISYGVNRFDPDDEWEGEDDFHQVVWSNQTNYTYYPSSSNPDEDVVSISVIHIEEGRALIQVMLAMVG